jgi:hypothetical protein
MQSWETEVRVCFPLISNLEGELTPSPPCPETNTIALDETHNSLYHHYLPRPCSPLHLLYHLSLLPLHPGDLLYQWDPQVHQNDLRLLRFELDQNQMQSSYRLYHYPLILNFPRLDEE